MKNKIKEIKAYKVNDRVFEKKEDAEKATEDNLIKALKSHMWQDEDFAYDSDSLIDVLHLLINNGVTSKQKLESLLDNIKRN